MRIIIRRSFLPAFICLLSGGLISISISGHFFNLWARKPFSQVVIAGLPAIFIGAVIYFAWVKYCLVRTHWHGWAVFQNKYLPVLGISAILYLSLVNQPVEVVTQKHRLDIISIPAANVPQAQTRTRLLEIVASETRLTPYTISCSQVEFMEDGLTIYPGSNPLVSCYFSTPREGGEIKLLFEESPQSGVVQLVLDGRNLPSAGELDLHSQSEGSKQVTGAIPANYLPGVAGLIDTLSISILLILVLLASEDQVKRMLAKPGWVIAGVYLICIAANMQFMVNFSGLDGNFLAKISTLKSNSFTNLINIGRDEEFNFFFGFYGNLQGKGLVVSPHLEKELKWNNIGAVNILDMFDLKNYDVVAYESTLSDAEIESNSGGLRLEYPRLDGKGKYILLNKNNGNDPVYIMMKNMDDFYILPYKNPDGRQ
jgi:hypothetical protein